MTEDEREKGEDRSSRRPDPAFLEELEDDALWQAKWSHEAYTRSERRVDRLHRRQGLDAREEQGSRGPRQGPARREGHRRLLALIVLVVAVVAIAIVGMEAKASELGTSNPGKTVPFQLVPLDTEGLTTTTALVTTTTMPASTDTSSPASGSTDSSSTAPESTDESTTETSAP